MDEESAAAQENPPKTRRQQAPGISGCSWHTLAVEEVVESLQTDAKAGLSAGEADRRLTRYGPNTLVEAKGRSALSIFAAQFNSLIVGLLVAAGVVALVLGDQVEAAAILVVILFNAAVGYATEWRAERDLDGLRKQTVATAQVVRGGLARRIPAADLVPGDLVVLNSGDRVPADGRLVEGTRLRIEEAAMTGESVPVAKIFAPIPDANAPLGDRLNCVFLGTAVTDGRGRLLVTATGARTELGRIGTMLEEAGDRETPLERQLARLGRHLIFLVLILCGVIVAAGWAQGHDLLYMLEVGISLAIAAVPEGLTAVTTMTLAIGVQRMARMGALVRRLPAVETLGSTTVICTDKTGTLTRNEMTMQALRLGDRSIEFTGVGYGVEGNACENGQYVDPADDAHLALALRIGALCSDAKLDEGSDEPTVLGDPTEVALLIAARKGGLTKEALEREYPRVGEAPFSSASMRMTTVHRTPEGRLVAFVKGAPGALAKASSAMLIDGATKPMTSQDRERVLKANRELAGRAFRVLALACKDVPAGYADHDLTDGLTFVGLVAMIDPLREEAGPAIDKCRRAGIRTVMITGDQEATAAEIGRQLGLDRDPKGRPLRTAHGRELAGLDEAGRRALAADVGVFARVSPEDKLRLVEALQAGGEVVAMTGDGVNDAPALKQADIGVAMGVKGTEIAKDASAMVVTDDDFATIVGAIEQGRIVYANIQRFVLYLFSCNLAEILVVFVAILIGWPLPLLALQVLWLNIVTDVFPALALALEPSNRGVMESPPRDPKESMISPPIMRLVAWQGAMLSAVTLIAFAVGLHWYGDEGEGLSQAVTIAFMTLALTQTFHTFNCRSKSRSAFTDRVFTNRWLWGAVGACVFLQSAALYVPLLQRVLHTTPVSAADWLLILACSVAPVALVEFVKFVKRAC